MRILMFAWSWCAISIAAFLAMVVWVQMEKKRIKEEIDGLPKEPMAHCLDCGAIYPKKHSLWMEVPGVESMQEICPLCYKRNSERAEAVLKNTHAKG